MPMVTEEEMQDDTPRTLTLHSGSPEETQRLGLAVGEQARSGDVYLLTGPLGAGKTCFTQGLARGLGVEGYVRSPTFVLMTRHRGRLTLHHIDLYRIGSLEEAWDLGLDEQLFDSGVCVIEWAERAEELLPEDALWVEFGYGDRDGNREIALDCPSPRYDDLLLRLNSLETSFTAGTG